MRRTMKKFLSLIFAISLTLSACGTVSTQPTPPAQTGTPTITATTTQTPTPTITPLPTIPTFTPTFDVSTIVTVTPAEKAECPQKTSYHEILLPQPVNEGSYPSGDIIQPILNFLNSGGDIEYLIIKLKEVYTTYSPRIISVDITNDKNPEIILDGVINEDQPYSQDHILTCIDGQFVNLDVIPDRWGSRPSFQCCISFIEDLNSDGVPEIITGYGYGSGGSFYDIYGWDGFILKRIAGFEASTFSDEKIETANHNGLKKLIVISKDSMEVFRHFDKTIRDRIITLEWNGENFVILENYLSPKFRFQAIQDADIAVINGDFHKAFSSYQETIFSDTLGWWSLSSYKQQFQAGYWGSEATPITVTLDPAEYPSLAVYAYYRIVLLHLVQGQDAEAASTYQTLQDTFGSNQYAAPYIEMATAFWEAYQSTQKMYDGCAAAIQYAVEHPEILIPLGSDYHGWQAKIYEPADVCPFR
jgi:hypothetical protein